MAEIIVIVLLLVIGGLMGSAITLILVARPQAFRLRHTAVMLHDAVVRWTDLEQENKELRRRLGIGEPD